jgi:hypothetical protein
VPTLRGWFELVVSLAAMLLVVAPAYLALLLLVDMFANFLAAAACVSAVAAALYLLVIGPLSQRVALRRFATANGWEPVDTRDWPWTTRLHEGDPSRSTRTGAIRVRTAWRLPSDKYPVIVGEISFTGDILDDVIATKGSGRPFFVLVTLPQNEGSMATRHHFERHGDDSRVHSARMNIPFVRGHIPPWTIRDRELFTFQNVRPTPNGVNEAVRRTLHIVDLLADTY